MTADVLAQAEQIAVRREQAGRVETTGRLEGRLPLPEPVRERRDERGRDTEIAHDRRRLDGDGLEGAFAANPAGRGRVEETLERAAVEFVGIDLDRVRGEVVREASRPGGDALGEAKAERKLLVVTWSPHRHRDRATVDADLERFLDGEPIDDRVTVRPAHRLSRNSGIRRHLECGFLPRHWRL